MSSVLKVSKSGIVKLTTKITSPKGWLVVAEEAGGIPFVIRRVYWIGGVGPGISRGGHAHKQTRQVIFCLKGDCDLKLDDGVNIQTIKLRDPSEGIILEPGLWHEMFNFSADCVLLVLADSPYNEGDYIRDYQQFKS